MPESIKKTIDIISLGCSKNLVESEKVFRQMEARGYKVKFDPETVKADYVVINTCGFISDAKEESINTILQVCEKKNEGEVGEIIVMGCLSQRYLEDLKKEIPEVDHWFGKFDWPALISSLPDLSGKKKPPHWERKISTPSHHAYLKISEGCNRFCAFCAIPSITGRHNSRPIEEIEEEVRYLVKKGVKEFNVIAQDLSAYGTDIYGRQALAELIERIADIPGVEWIRLHYAYPAGFPMDVLDVMARRPNVCKYLDIALQHIADPVLQNMRRHISKTETIDLLKTIRERVPGIKIRTTLMTGFPGEGEKEFEELMDFVKTQKFERMGAFTYCEEDDTFAAKNLIDSLPQAVKQERLDRLMDLQQAVSQRLNEEMVGTIHKVIIDRIEDGIAYCRSQFDSPEVDPEVLININELDKNKGIIFNTLKPGDFLDVEITEAYPFELFAIPANKLKN